jgi:GDP-4-dehydro-6-deoxy-D-mannose reductase
MRVAVTGADGFVGRHLCAHLAACGDAVLAMRGPQPSGAPTEGVVEVTDERAVTAALEPFAPDAVIHLAGVSSVARSHEAPLETFRVNVLGAVNVCATLRQVAPKARVLIVGSGEVYGPTLPGSPAREDSPLVPLSPYAASKAAAEVAALQFHRAYGLAVIAARPFNHIGRGQAPSFAIPSFARQLCAMRGSGVLSVGNLEPIRDFSHVEDVVRAYRLLLERGAAGETYNVASGEGRSIRSVVEEMIRVSAVDARLEVDPGRVRAVELPSLVGDATKLRSLGWMPKRTVRDALEDALLDARSARSTP